MKSWCFLDDNGVMIYTEAVSELAARRKIRRTERTLNRAGVVRRRRGKLLPVQGPACHWPARDFMDVFIGIR